MSHEKYLKLISQHILLLKIHLEFAKFLKSHSSHSIRHLMECTTLEKKLKSIILLFFLLLLLLLLLLCCCVMCFCTYVYEWLKLNMILSQRNTALESKQTLRTDEKWNLNDKDQITCNCVERSDHSKSNYFNDWN